MTLLDDLMDKWEELREEGETITPEELCAEAPHLLAEVKKQIVALLAVSAKFGKFARFEADANEDRLPPKHIELPARYEIIRLHASGGLGNVYLALDKVLDRPVAIKFLKTSDFSPEQFARFEWEARVTGRLEHPGIVPIHSMQENATETPCYVMRFVDGQTFQQLVEKLHDGKSGGLGAGLHSTEAFRRQLQSLISVCNIVSFAHSRGVVHRDIKPSNIILGPFGEVLLLDWGISKLVDPQRSAPSNATGNEKSTASSASIQLVEKLESPKVTSTGEAMGTPAYSSPEQWLGYESAAATSSDIFSLGITLFYLIAGQSPAEILGWGQYVKHCQRANANFGELLPSHTPRKLRAIVHRATHMTLALRYASVAEFSGDLEGYLAKLPISAAQDDWLEWMSRGMRNHPRLTSAIIASSIAILVSLTATTFIVLSKNSQLLQAEISLSQSLDRTRLANTQTRAALNSLLGDLAITHFASREELTGEDRAYLVEAIDQYNQLAELVDESSNGQMGGEIVRAEAKYNIALMMSWLGQEVESTDFARESVEVYAAVYVREPNSKIVSGYLKSLSLLSGLEARYGDVRHAIELAHRGLEVADQAKGTLSQDDPVELFATRASLHSDLSIAYIQASDWGNALAHTQAMLEESQRQLSMQPGDYRANLNLAAAYSRLAELSTHQELSIAPQSAIDFSNRAVALRKAILDRAPNHGIHRVNWAKSLYSRALCQSLHGDIKLSVEDLQMAIDVLVPMQLRYPAIDDWRASLVQCRTLFAANAYQLEDWSGMAKQIGESLELRLSLEAMSVFIELLEKSYSKLEDHETVDAWISELKSRRETLAGQ